MFFYKLFFSFGVVAVMIFFASGFSQAGWVELDDLTNATFYSIDAYGDQVYAVGSEGEILYSSDGGHSWKFANNNPTDKRLRAVAAFKDGVAVAVGDDGTILRTTDGGQIWVKRSADKSYGQTDFYDIAMLKDGTGYLVGENGLILSGSSDGRDWETVSSPTDEDLLAVKILDDSHIWAVGDNGTIIKTTDGEIWNLVESQSSSTLTTVDFFDSSHGWIGGAAGIFLTTSDGEEWKREKIDELTSGEGVVVLSFLSSTDGYLEGSNGTHLMTKDGGLTWLENSEFSDRVFLRGFSLDLVDRYVSGTAGKILKYDASNPTSPQDFIVTNGDPQQLPVFSWTAASDDDTEVAYYEIKIDGGNFINLGLVETYIWEEDLPNGQHTAYLQAVDLAGNTSSESSVVFSYSGSEEKAIGTISPLTALVNFDVNFHVDLNDPGLSTCYLFVDDQKVGTMTVVENQAFLDYVFVKDGQASVYVTCDSVDGFKNTSDVVKVTVNNSISGIAPGDLLKISCSDSVSCSTVYFYGGDGKRHAFPNEAVFNSWFVDFSLVKDLSAEVMAEIPLGHNITYKPASRLVKFVTNNTVYAVSYGGILRPVDNEALAQALYGLDWAEQVDDIADVFFSNYQIGLAIESSDDFDISDIVASAESVPNFF